MKASHWLAGAALAATLALGATPAMAGTSAGLLKRLLDKGILTEEEYKTLLAEDQAEAPKSAPAAAMDKADEALGGKHVVTMTDSGIGLNVGPATITFSGSVNGFYTSDNPHAATATSAVAGGVVNVGEKTSSVRNGLLPGFLKVDVTTKQGGWDVGAHFGLYPGINSTNWGALGANNGGQPTGLATAGIDFRQTFLTVGKAGFGELKIGRDIGLFGSDAILNDITLLSVGTPGGNAAPGNTSLGRIGTGYIYTDFQPQITYTSPAFAGAHVSVGVFQPLSSLTGAAQTNSQPGFQGKVSWDGKLGPVATHFWVSGITQQHDSTGFSYTGQGVDVGAKVTGGPLTVTGYYYTASGLGTTALGLLDTDASGNTRNSDGFYIQALGTFGKFSVGASYGESSLKFANAADALATPTLVKTNSSVVGQVRYGLTSWVTLIGEYINTKSKAHNGNSASDDTVALGAILFF